MSGRATRRAVLGAGAAMLACAPAAATIRISAMVADPDADLQRLSDDWLRLERQIDEQIVRQGRKWEVAGCPGNEGEDTTVSDAMIHEQSAVMTQLAETKAKTPQGIRAKAKVLSYWIDPVGRDRQLEYSLITDLLAGEA